jgi:CheY-like chemotaxis protein
MVIAAYLRDCGFDVVEAGSADEAVRVLEAGLRIDIVFSDVSMPGSLDGFGLARWVRRERPELKVILTSGAVRTAKDATDFSAHGPIVAKPYNHAKLASQLRALLVR